MTPRAANLLDAFERAGADGLSAAAIVQAIAMRDSTGAPDRDAVLVLLRLIEALARPIQRQRYRTQVRDYWRTLKGATLTDERTGLKGEASVGIRKQWRSAAGPARFAYSTHVACITLNALREFAASNPPLPASIDRATFDVVMGAATPFAFDLHVHGWNKLPPATRARVEQWRAIAIREGIVQVGRRLRARDGTTLKALAVAQRLKVSASIASKEMPHYRSVTPRAE